MKYTHTVGEVQHLMRPILDRYPSSREAIAAVGISAESYYRIMKADSRARLNTPTYEKIIAASAVLSSPVAVTPGGESSWAAAAEYARTPEGAAFVEWCRRPLKYRQEVAA